MANDPVEFEDDSPLDRFTEGGCRVNTKRVTHTSSTSIQGMEVSSGTTYRCKREWKLPKAVPVQASFVREGFTHKLTKLFSGEIQVGDPMFDDAVYISTATADATRAFLEQPGVRDAIFGFVTSGGSFTVEGDTMIVEVSDDIDPDVLPSADDEASILAALT